MVHVLDLEIDGTSNGKVVNIVQVPIFYIAKDKNKLLTLLVIYFYRWRNLSTISRLKLQQSIYPKPYFTFFITIVFLLFHRSSQSPKNHCFKANPPSCSLGCQSYFSLQLEVPSSSNFLASKPASIFFGEDNIDDDPKQIAILHDFVFDNTLRRLPVPLAPLRDTFQW